MTVFATEASYRLIKTDDAVVHMLVLDRSVDPVTPQLQARTYAGTLYEQYKAIEIKALSSHPSMFGSSDKVQQVEICVQIHQHAVSGLAHFERLFCHPRNCRMRPIDARGHRGPAAAHSGCK